MLYLIGQIWEKFGFFSSIYLRVFIAFTISFLIVLYGGQPFIDYLRKKKYGESIRVDGPQTHFSKKGTPTMGGVLVVAAIISTSLITGNLSNPYNLYLMLVTVLFAGIGFIDDYMKFTVNKKGLSGKKKLLGQMAIGCLTWLFMVYLRPEKLRTMDYSIMNPITHESAIYIGAFGLLIFILIITMASSNAVNITDGLDGLATMPVIISSIFFAVIAYFTGHTVLSNHLALTYTEGVGEITVFLGTVCGAGLGFLWYNFYPAQIFMGDTGSLTLGGILGTVAVLLKQELLLPVVGGVFVMEAMSVIIQVTSFKLTGKRVFKMAPIHHHFELGGQAESKVTMRFWIVSIMFGILALGLIRLRGIL